MTPPVLRISDLPGGRLAELCRCYGIRLSPVPAGTPIPGSYWGEPEAGLMGCCLYVRADTPVHSALHEACHYICMTPERRRGLDTDAGGDELEESGVCLLQILLADGIEEVGRARILADMDAWGYSFRLGSAAAWFDGDAADARAWLRQQGLVGNAGRPTFNLRGVGSGMDRDAYGVSCLDPAHGIDLTA